MSKNETRLVVMTDNHGSHGDPDTLNAVMAFCKDFKPHYKWHLGDNWDFACLRKGVSQDERDASWSAMDEDVQAGIEWLNRYRPSHFVFGNHDNRVRKLIINTDSRNRLDALEKVERAMSKAIRQAGVKVVRPYTVHDNIVSVGPIDGGHGFGGNPLRYAMTYHRGHGRALLCGHWHTARQEMVKRYEGGVFWMLGAACNLRMDYSDTHISSLGHQNGFMAFIIKDRHYIGRQAHKFNGRWLMPFSS